MLKKQSSITLFYQTSNLTSVHSISDRECVESEVGSDQEDAAPGPQEVTMPMLEALEPPAPFSPVRTKSPGSGAPAPTSGVDLLKNPFLLPAHLLALNPNLYAAQLAQLQAAQFLFAKQQGSESGSGDKNGAMGSPDTRKRSIEEDSPLDLGSKAAKYPRSSSPIDGRREPNSESPLDLSGNKSPDVKRDMSSSFNPLLPPNLLSFFNQMQQNKPSPDLVTSLMGLGAHAQNPGLQRLSPRSASPSPPVSAVSPRGSPWQSQWISKTSEGTRIEDVFKCVWCKESYQTLEALTSHMKEAKHHSMPYPLAGQTGPLRPGAHPRVSSPLRPPVSMTSPLSSMSSSPKPAPVRDILKEQLPIPRKLVRGQDVWIGRADQQTRDILKCMSCGESFRSLELLTKHMQETQHYKKVMSHDQISSWKYPEAQQQASSKNHVNSVLSCKVCDKGFSSLKDLSDHMVKANHYTPESGAKMPRHHPAAPSAAQVAAAKDRKKALPVKKLLELERARHEVMGGASAGKALNNARDIMESGKLGCERCEEKIPLDFYIAHIQQCVGRPSPAVTVKSEDPGEKTAEAEKKSEAHSSILGSLEQLVKGNLLGSQQKRQTTVASPPSQLSSLSKFSIQNMFGKDSARASSPSSGLASPSSSRPSSQPSPSPEKMPVSSVSPVPLPVIPEKANGVKVKQEVETSCQMEETSAVSPVNGDHSNGDKDDTEAPGDRSDEEVTTSADSKSPPPLVAKLSLGGQDKPETKSDSPLAALQMLCDTQKKTPKTPKISESSPSESGSMLAFSWACNQAVSGDSVIKCPFCDTPFISKGAYRHHLSKMHFKEAGMGAPGQLEVRGQRSPSPDTKETQGDSLQNKYQKYAQLAKQLSCNQK